MPDPIKPGERPTDQYLLGREFSFKAVMEAFAQLLFLPVAATVVVASWVARPFVEAATAGNRHVSKTLNYAVSENNFLDKFNQTLKTKPQQFFAWTAEPFTDPVRYALHQERKILDEPDPTNILAINHQQRLAAEHAAKRALLIGSSNSSPGASPLYPTGTPVDIRSHGLLL